MKHGQSSYSLPDDGVLTGLVLGFSLHTNHLHAAGVEGCWDAHLKGEQALMQTLHTQWRTVSQKKNCSNEETVHTFHNVTLNRADLDLLSQERGFEVGLDDHLNLQFSAAHLPDQRDNSERQDDVLSGAVSARRREDITVNLSLSSGLFLNFSFGCYMVVLNMETIH